MRKTYSQWLSEWISEQKNCLMGEKQKHIMSALMLIADAYSYQRFLVFERNNHALSDTAIIDYDKGFAIVVKYDGELELHTFGKRAFFRDVKGIGLTLAVQIFTGGYFHDNEN